MPAPDKQVDRFRGHMDKPQTRGVFGVGQARQGEIQATVQQLRAQHVAGCHHHLDLHLHKRLPQGRQRGQDTVHRRAGHSTQPHVPAGAVLDFRQFAARILDIDQHLRRAPRQSGPAGRQYYTPAGTPVQGGTGDPPDLGQQAAGSGLRNPQLRRRRPDLPLRPKRRQQPQMADLQSATEQHHISILVCFVFQT